jgi:hypothetical protein
MRLRKGRHSSHHLPLRHLVDGIDVIHPLDSIPISLVHRVHPQIARLASRLGPPPLSDGHLHGPCRAIAQPAFAVVPPPAQVVNVGHRDRRQPLILSVLVLLTLAHQNPLGGWAGERFVRFVHLRQ